MPDKTFNEFKFFCGELKAKLKDFCKVDLCKMFKVRQGVIVTDEDGVQDNCNNEFLFDYFLCYRRGF